MHVVDASVWVSRFVPGDEHYVFSQNWLKSVIERDELLASPALILPEVAGAIARRTGSVDLGSRAVTLLQRLPDARMVSVDGELAQVAARLAGKLHLRGADAVYLALAYQLSIPMVTWDREQLARGGRVTTVLSPEQALKG